LGVIDSLAFPMQRFEGTAQQRARCWVFSSLRSAAPLESIRKLRSIEREENAELWPSHDIDFFNALPQFPAWRE
jgi:hypothetical protein